MTSTESRLTAQVNTANHRAAGPQGAGGQGGDGQRRGRHHQPPVPVITPGEIRQAQLTETEHGVDQHVTVPAEPSEQVCQVKQPPVLDDQRIRFSDRLVGADRLVVDPAELLQDLRRSLLDPPRQLRPRSAAITQPEDQPEAVRATA